MNKTVRKELCASCQTHLVVVNIETARPSGGKLDEKTSAKEEGARHVEQHGSLGESRGELGMRHARIGHGHGGGHGRHVVHGHHGHRLGCRAKELERRGDDRPNVHRAGGLKRNAFRNNRVRCRRQYWSCWCSLCIENMQPHTMT